MPIPSIDEHAGKGREDHRGNLPAESDDAEEELGAGEPVDQPAGGDARNPGAHEREALPAEEQAVVAMAERAGQITHRLCSVRNVIEHCKDATSGMLCCHSVRGGPFSTYA